MGAFGKILTLTYDSAEAVKSTSLKTYYRSVRLIKDVGTVNPLADSEDTNVLLCGTCIDKETRNLYVFYIDTSVFKSAWIIEFNLDKRESVIVYFDKNNDIGFSPLHKIYNARVVSGRIIWTDNFNPIYQIDIARAKRSWYYKIGYGQYPNTVEWDASTPFGIDQIVSNGTYFYKSVIDANLGTEPRLGDATKWTKLCLIEDAYYSMNVENFLFAPVPPKHAPIVVYEEDNDRKINNLRQTLFQAAYRYVYMDWRRSTLSPASIVPVPQAEEETATGLASERIALNNKLRITVNLGGEEVRAVEVIARSSDDPSTWYLIETINKFEQEERGGEVSIISKAPSLTLSITIQQPIAKGPSLTYVYGYMTLNIAIKTPTVLMSYVYLTVTDMLFLWTDGGVLNKQITVIDCVPIKAYITNISDPSWIVVTKDTGEVLTEGLVGEAQNMVSNIDTLWVYPAANNGGLARQTTITITNIYGNSVTITATQEPAVWPPLVDVSKLVGDPMTLTAASGTLVLGSRSVDITFTPGNTAGTVRWRAEFNSVVVGFGTFAVTNGVVNYKTVNIIVDVPSNETVYIYLSRV